MRFSKLAAATAALLLVPALASCSSDTAGSSGSAAASQSAVVGVAPLPTGGPELANTKWSLSGASYATGSLLETGITLDFSADQASGKTPLNTYNADYTSATDGSLSFTQINATQMAGEADLMAEEAKYLAALATVTGYSENGDLLDLFAGPDQVLTLTSDN